MTKYRWTPGNNRKKKKLDKYRYLQKHKCKSTKPSYDWGRPLVQLFPSKPWTNRVIHHEYNWKKKKNYVYLITLLYVNWVHFWDQVGVWYTLFNNHSIELKLLKIQIHCHFPLKKHLQFGDFQTRLKNYAMRKMTDDMLTVKLVYSNVS